MRFASRATSFVCFAVFASLVGCISPFPLDLDTNAKDVKVNYVCSPLTCTGCCSNNICRGGNENDGCGYDGRACSQCTGNSVCEAPGTCVGYGSLPHHPTPDAGCFVVERKLLCW